MSAARCPTEILLVNAPAALAAAREALAAGEGRLDLSPLVRLDSAAVAVLIALRREAGARASFLNPPANLRALAQLYGVDALLFDSVSSS